MSTEEETEPEEVVVEEIDEDANDQVRLWEDGWKERYYKVKFDVENEDIDFRRKVVSVLLHFWAIVRMGRTHNYY